MILWIILIPYQSISQDLIVFNMKTVFTVGIELPGHVGEYVEFSSDKSLLDADIVVFLPNMSDVHDSSGGYYKGKRCYGDHASFELKERIAHWRREIRAAVDSGKTVFFLLNDKDEEFVDSGQRTHSGTGRNAQTTRIVEPCSNYDVLCNLSITIYSTINNFCNTCNNIY